MMMLLLTCSLPHTMVLHTQKFRTHTTLQIQAGNVTYSGDVNQRDIDL